MPQPTPLDVPHCPCLQVGALIGTIGLFMAFIASICASCGTCNNTKANPNTEMTGVGPQVLTDNSRGGGAPPSAPEL